MSLDRKEYISRILNGINTEQESPDAKKIFFIGGLFGIGKSWLVEELEKELFSEKCFDSIFSYSNQKNIDILPQFLNELAGSYRDSDYSAGAFQANETIFNLSSYTTLLNQVHDKDPMLYREYAKYYFLQSYSDYLLNQEPEEKVAEMMDLIGKRLGQIYGKKGEQRLMTQTSEVACESFIVDLMSMYYPIEEDQTIFNFLNFHKKKIKIVIIIDNYENVAGSINKWLADTFFKYCYEYKFSDFISFNISHIPQDIKISDLFDFRIIISGRENTQLINKLKENNFKQYSEIELKPFSIDSVKHFIDQHPMKAETNVETFLQLSYGIPHILILWLEYYLLGNGDNDTTIIYRNVADLIFKYKSENLRDAIRCVAFLDEIDQNSIRCFPQLNQNYKNYYNYFANSTELLDPLKYSEGKIVLHPIVRDFIMEITNRESHKISHEYEKIAQTIKKTKDLFRDLDDEEVEILRHFAYFKRFDNDFVSKELYIDDYFKIQDLIKRNHFMFNKHQFTMSLKDEYCDIIVSFNKLIDNFHYEDKTKIPEKIWNKYSDSINDYIIQKEKEIFECNKEDLVVQKEISENQKLLKENQTYYIAKENSIINLKKHLNKLTSKKNHIFGTVYFLLGAILAAFNKYYLEPNFVNQETGSNSFLLIFLFSIAAILLGFSIYHFGKVFQTLMMKSEIQELFDNLENDQKDKTKYLEEINRLKENLTNAELNSGELMKQIKTARNEIELRKSMLLEKFI